MLQTTQKHREELSPFSREVGAVLDSPDGHLLNEPNLNPAREQSEDLDLDEFMNVQRTKSDNRKAGLGADKWRKQHSVPHEIESG